MKKDVKTDILETARKLFNEQGYNLSLIHI